MNTNLLCSVPKTNQEKVQEGRLINISISYNMHLFSLTFTVIYTEIRGSICDSHKYSCIHENQPVKVAFGRPADDYVSARCR